MQDIPLVSITSSSRVLAGPTGAKVVRPCSLNGPNRDTTVELLTGSYSVTSMLPWSWRPRSVRTMLGSRRAVRTGTRSITSLPQGTWAPWRATRASGDPASQSAGDIAQLWLPTGQ